MPEDYSLCQVNFMILCSAFWWISLSAYMPLPLQSCLHSYFHASLFGTAAIPAIMLLSFHLCFCSCLDAFIPDVILLPLMLLPMLICFYHCNHAPTPSLIFLHQQLLYSYHYFGIPIPLWCSYFCCHVFLPATMLLLLHWCIHTCIDVSIPELLHLLLLACLIPCSHVSIPILVVLSSFEALLAVMFLSKLSCLHPCIDAFIPALMFLSLMSCSCLNNKSSIPGTTLVFKIWCTYICYDAFITALIPPLLIQGFYPCCDDTISVSISAIMHLSLFLWFY